MRKSFTLVFFLAICCTGVQAQKRGAKPVGTPYQKFSLYDTVKMPGIPRDELYSRAWRWFAEASKRTPSLLEEADRRYGRFTGTSSILFVSKQAGGSEYVKGKIYYNITVFVEDERYIYRLTDFTHLSRISFNAITTHPYYPNPAVANQEWHNLVWQEIKEHIRTEMGQFMGSFKENMRIETEKFGHYKAISERSPLNSDIE